MQKFEYSKISKSTFNVEQTTVTRPKILQTFLNSLDKNIKFNIYSDFEFQKLTSDEIVYFDEYGSLNVNVPKDPKPWEVMNIINLIDNYTIADSEIEGELKGVVFVNEISDRFLNLSYYLISNLENISYSKDIVIEMIFDFYNFGHALKNRALCDFPQNYDFNNFPQINEETEIDSQKWLFGTEGYDELQKKFSKKVHYNLVNKIPLSYEENQNYKISALNRYFKDLVSNSIKLKQLKSKKFSFRNFENDYLKTPLGNIFLENLNANIKYVNEFAGSCKNNDKFYVNIYSCFSRFLGTYFFIEQEKFFSKPEFILIKKELQEARNFKNIELISKIELDLIRKIQNEILNFPYRRIRSINTETLSDEILNYLVSFSLSFYIFTELKFEFLVADIHLHSAFVFKLSDKTHCWIDLTPPVGDRFNFKIVDSLIKTDELVFNKINSVNINIMKWCHTHNFSGKRIQFYSSLIIKDPRDNSKNSTDFGLNLFPPDLGIKNLPIRILNNFLS